MGLIDIDPFEAEEPFFYCNSCGEEVSDFTVECCEDGEIVEDSE